MKFVKATCPACGGSLEVANNFAHANCPHCGSKIIMDWEGQTSLGVHLDLGKTFLQAENCEEADKHFSHALEKNPQSGDAWFWKGITKIASIRSVVDTDKDALFRQSKTYLQKSGFTRNEMFSNLVSLFEGKRLFEMFLSIRPLIDENISMDKSYCDLFMSAAAGAENDPLTREKLILEIEQHIATIQSLLSEAVGEERKRLYKRFRSECNLARIYLSVLLPDQPGEKVHGKKDWWEKSLIGAKPSYWLEYLNRQERQYEQKI